MNTVSLFLLNAISIAIQFLYFAVIARIIISWVSPNFERDSRVGQFLYDITEPLVNIARLIPHRFGMFDLASLYVLIALNVVLNILGRL